jgi:hypothetical protein
MTACSFRILAGIAVAFALLSPGEASARGFVLVTWGDTVSHVGNAPPQAKQSHGGSNVGYKYHYWGIFWIDLWTSDGTYCVYEGNRYNPISSAEAAKLLGKSESDLTTPFLYRWPLGWMIFGSLIVIGIIGSLLSKDGSDGVAALFQDPRYQQALTVLNERYTASAALVAAGQVGDMAAPSGDEAKFQAAFQSGVEHLVKVGVAREEAERNLAVMVHVLAQSAQQEAAGANGGSAEQSAAGDRPRE